MNVLKSLQRVVTAVAGTQKPVLPQCVQDLDPEERKRRYSPPTSPLQEVVVLDFFAVNEKMVLQHPSFSVV